MEKNNKPRKIFAAFLGTNPYEECIYYIDKEDINKTEKKTKYIQKYLIDKYCGDWTEEDKIIFFITEVTKKTTGKTRISCL